MAAINPVVGAQVRMSPFQVHPERTRAVLLFAIAIILFSASLSLGVTGLAANQNSLPDWLKSAVTALKTEGLVRILVSGYIVSALLSEGARSIHSDALMQHEEKVNPKSKFDRMFETATRVPRAILATAIDVAFLPVAGLLLLIACCKSNYDPAQPKRNKIPILQIHGSGFCEIEWVASKPWLSKDEYGSVFTLNLDGLASNQHQMGIHHYAKKIREKIKMIKEKTNQKEVILMGHSMGGLVAAFYAEKYAKKDRVAVRHVISIATPWHGAPLLNCQNDQEKPKRYEQMTENNNFLRALVYKALKSDRKGRRTYYSIGTSTDFMVPGPSSLLSEKRQNTRLFSWLGHYGVIAYPGTWLQIRSCLNQIYKNLTLE